MRYAPLAAAFATVWLIGGCAANQGAQPSAAATPAPAAQAAPGSPSVSTTLGPPLSEAQFRTLVVGNTLFRPLATGGTTVIYVASDQSMRLRIVSTGGKAVSDKGRETLSPDKVCWEWEHAGSPLCFKYYWNGRLLTLEAIGSKIQPSQFLIEKGNAEKI